MNTTSKLALAAATTAALGAATATAYAGSSLNGPQLTGIAIESIKTHRPTVTAVGLPSSEGMDPRRQAAPVGGTADLRQPARD